MSAFNNEDSSVRYAAWSEWKRICDWRKCDANTRNLLGTFVFVRLKSALNICARSEKEWSPVRYEDFFVTEGEDCESKNLKISFLTLESHLLARKQIKGKKPKDWLFECGTLNVVEGRVSSGIKTAIIRAIIGKKRRKPRITTFDPQTQPDAEEGHSVSAELLNTFFRKGDPNAKDVESYEKAALQVSQNVLASSSNIARVVHVAKCCKVSTADPRVNKAAGAQKSKLSKEYNLFLQSIKTAIDTEEFAPDELSEQRFFARLILSFLDQMIVKWAKSAEKMEWAASIIEDMEKENA